MSTSKIAVVGLLALVFGGYVISQQSTVVVTHQATDEVVATSTEPSIPQEWLDEAEKAKEQVLKKKKLEAERASLLKEVDEREARIEEIEKELGF
jgi:hypothetical protein